MGQLIPPVGKMFSKSNSTCRGSRRRNFGEPCRLIASFANAAVLVLVEGGSRLGFADHWFTTRANSSVR